ncbi:hypothetical protein [uncultured Dialister sp.]|uniref:hypothetical protein n=1 Tax=uncultured Dialister sp. TaxID=278064 RepID=UPI00349E5FAB
MLKYSPNLIPCFNSSVIEAYIWRIPSLSEHFLYGNDDMFFYKPLSPDFFFTQGKPIAHLKFDEEIKKYGIPTISNLNIPELLCGIKI